MDYILKNEKFLQRVDKVLREGLWYRYKPTTALTMEKEPKPGSKVKTIEKIKGEGKNTLVKVKDDNGDHFTVMIRDLVIFKEPSTKRRRRLR